MRSLLFVAIYLIGSALGGVAQAKEPALRDITNVVIIDVTYGVLRTCGIRDFNRNRVFARYLELRRKQGMSKSDLAELYMFWARHVSYTDRQRQLRARQSCDADSLWRVQAARKRLEAGISPE